MPPGAPPPIGVIHRFGLFIEALKRVIAEGAGRDRSGPDRDGWGPMAVLLCNYLGRTLRRLAALSARFAAGAPVVRRRRVPVPGLPADRPEPERRPHRTLPRLPAGVLARYHAGHFCTALRQLVEEPEMRSLLEAAPQAGRLLRPLWRMLTADPLPQALRPPPRPPRSAPLSPPAPDAAAATPPLDTPPPETMRRRRRAAPAPPPAPIFPPPLWPAKLWPA